MKPPLSDSNAQALLRSLYATGKPQSLAQAMVGEVVIVAGTDPTHDKAEEHWFCLMQVWKILRDDVRLVTFSAPEPMHTDSRYCLRKTEQVVYLDVRTPID